MIPCFCFSGRSDSFLVAQEPELPRQDHHHQVRRHVHRILCIKPKPARRWTLRRDSLHLRCPKGTLYMCVSLPLYIYIYLYKYMSIHSLHTILCVQSESARRWTLRRNSLHLRCPKGRLYIYYISLYIYKYIYIYTYIYIYIYIYVCIIHTSI